MATHSSVLAWRIPGTEEPSGLPSMGLHRVGHDWSDLAAADHQFTEEGWWVPTEQRWEETVRAAMWWHGRPCRCFFSPKNSPQRVPAATAAAQQEKWSSFPLPPPNALPPWRKRSWRKKLSNSSYIMSPLFPVVWVTEMCQDRLFPLKFLQPSSVEEDQQDQLAGLGGWGKKWGE